MRFFDPPTHAYVIIRLSLRSCLLHSTTLVGRLKLPISVHLLFTLYSFSGWAYGWAILPVGVLAPFNSPVEPSLKLRFLPDVTVCYRWYISCLLLQLGPWLAVEIPDLVSKGLIHHKEAGEAAR